MGFTNGKYGDNRYLIYQFAENDVIETMSFGQITNNTIPGLAPATFNQMDAVKSIMYNITSKISLEDFLQKPVKKGHLLSILCGIIQAVRSAQEYMIDPSVILLDKEHIFLKTSSFEMYLICLPVINDCGESNRIQRFLWDLVVKTPKDKSENREYVSELMEKLDPDVPLSLEAIAELLEDFQCRENEASLDLSSTISSATISSQTLLDSHAYNVPLAADTVQAVQASDSSTTQEKPVLGIFNRLKKQLGKMEFSKKKDSFDPQPVNAEHTAAVPAADCDEEYTVVERDPDYRHGTAGSGYFIDSSDTPSASANKGRGTVTMHDDSLRTIFDNSGSVDLSNVTLHVHLVRVNNNEMIPIKGTIFQIGSDYDYSDYCIRHNRTVGGTHARIINHHGEFFIKDINSKNHTYVNDEMIPSLEETRLHHGTRIRLGTERFVFKLYDDK